MDRTAGLIARMDPGKVQQGIKWTVYTLLLINFAYYITEDWNRALHTLGPEAGLLDWAGEFATSIDELGWFLLLFMFELETYVLDDETWDGWVAHVIHGVRLACFAMIGHTVYAYFVAATSLYPSLPAQAYMDSCDMAGADIPWVYNLEYTEITSGNCDALPGSGQLHWVEEGAVVSNAAGLELERELAWVDLAEAIIWLAIILAIEVVVRLQNRDITEGGLITAAKRLQLLLYAALIGIAVYWATLSHWLYFWDELLWIGGFAAIEMNLNDRRMEIIEGRGAI